MCERAGRPAPSVTGATKEASPPGGGRAERRRRRGHLRHPPREEAPGPSPGPAPRNDEEEQFLQEGECARRPRARLGARGTPARGGRERPRARREPRAPPFPAPRARSSRGRGLLFTRVGVSLGDAPHPSPRPLGPAAGCMGSARRGDNEK